MDFRDAYPDYVAIEEHIRRARLERSLAVAQLIADLAESAWKGLRKIGAVIVRAGSAQRVKEPLPTH